MDKYYFNEDQIGRLTHVNYNRDNHWMEEFYLYDGLVTTFHPWSGATVLDVRGGANAKGRLHAVLTHDYASANYQSFDVTAYDYTAQGQVSAKTYQTMMNDGATFTELGYFPYSYWYSDNGALQQMKYHSGRYVYYCMDDENGHDPNRPYEVRTGATVMDDCSDGELVAEDITYYPFGDIHSMTLGNGQVQHFDRDQRYALNQLKDGTSGDEDQYHKLDYTYDAFGNITGIADSSTVLGRYGSHSYFYDDLHQLTGSTIIIGSTYTQTFAYNAAGNRTSLVQNSQTQTYTYASNTNKLHLITGARSLEFTYNNLGALTLQSEYLAGGTYLFAGATYIPSGLIYGKDDWLQDGATIIAHGNTVLFHLSPSGEMLGKLNYTSGPKLFGYDLMGNLIEEGVPNDDTNPSSNEPIIDHIYLGGHRLASITGQGNVCIIATVAFGSPLAKELDVFRAFRDRVLLRMTPGRAFVNWYYERGPVAAAWLGRHEGPKYGARIVLTIVAVPLKALLFGGWPLLLLCVLCVFVVLLLSLMRRWRWTRTLAISFGVAFVCVIFYAYFIEVPKAMATYSKIADYYYTEDHIGRPFSLRDDSRTLRWFENHYAFGELINEQTPGDPMYAGYGDFQITWKPNFRFPGQYEDADQGIAYNNTSFFVQNHYREYMPGLGIYNRVDPLNSNIFNSHWNTYGYCYSNPLYFIDPMGMAHYDFIGGFSFDTHLTIGFGPRGFNASVGYFDNYGHWDIGFEGQAVWGGGHIGAYWDPFEYSGKWYDPRDHSYGFHSNTGFVTDVGIFEVPFVTINYNSMHYFQKVNDNWKDYFKRRTDRIDNYGKCPGDDFGTETGDSTTNGDPTR